MPCPTAMSSMRVQSKCPLHCDEEFVSALMVITSSMHCRVRFELRAAAQRSSQLGVMQTQTRCSSMRYLRRAPRGSAEGCPRRRATPRARLASDAGLRVAGLRSMLADIPWKPLSATEGGSSAGAALGNALLAKRALRDAGTGCGHCRGWSAEGRFALSSWERATRCCPGSFHIVHRARA